MKLYITIAILLMVVVLGCKPAPPAEVVPVAESEIDVDALLADYNPGEWITDYASAVKFANELKRPIFINFTGSDWCSWCIRLDKEVFSQPEFNNYAKESLILLKLDFPRSLPQSAELKTQNQSLQSKYGVRGYPTIVLIDHNEKEIGRTGYQQGGAVKYVSHIKELIQK
ncbi:MAG: thioredoxin family protein [Candidatus Cloacimonadaceae bacterium]|nr:thioredoxin family protein [Candidatus Cloacimonadaceae bacterium]